MNSMFLMSLVICLSCVFLFVSIRIWRGPSTADRVIAFDVLMACVIGISGICAALYFSSTIIDVLLVLATLSFVSSVGFAYYIERENS